ncbi:MAG: hypothetical protein OEV30_04790 [Ignavibacteria bacterium]|nr:hypothetical protein [Ignavibacteria bacterium]
MALRFETILSGADDHEKRQFLLLHGLKEYSREFSQNRLYPFLSELTELYRTLTVLHEKQDELREHFPRELKEVDLERMELVYDQTEDHSQNIGEMVQLIEWALPLVRNVMEEGMEIFNFVEDHITIAEVGITPIYRDEGYWFVPDARAHMLHLLRYEVSLFTSANERYRTLKTRLLDSVGRDSPDNTPESIKWKLIRQYHDLPNPATFSCETELDFPYGETMLPVAKRKLMAHLFA